MNTEILTANGVDINKGLELLGDMDMYNESLEDFLNESQDRIPKIQNYAATGDMPNYAILVHAMKSDSKYLGFDKLAEMSYQHEMESKASNQEFVNAHLDELLVEANRIIAVVSEYLGK